MCSVCAFALKGKSTHSTQVALKGHLCAYVCASGPKGPLAHTARASGPKGPLARALAHAFDLKVKCMRSVCI